MQVDWPAIANSLEEHATFEPPEHLLPGGHSKQAKAPLADQKPEAHVCAPPLDEVGVGQYFPAPHGVQVLEVPSLNEPGSQGTGISALQSWPAGQDVHVASPRGEYSAEPQF